MIFADKLIRLRKKSGMSQEELAEKMNVSRQSVSKWEGAQSVPDLEKILQLGNLFGVTTDYLLKDEVEDEEYSKGDYSEKERKISLEQANEFLSLRKKAAPRIALATFMCILSVIPLLVLGGLSEYGKVSISENFAGGIGMIILLIIVAAAVGIFIHTDYQSEAYKFLERETFEAEYGVIGMVREQQKAFRDKYVMSNIIGTCLCILSVAVLFVGAVFDDDFLSVIMLGAMLFIAGIGVYFFTAAGVRWASMQKLLKEGDYTDEHKSRSKMNGAIAGIYWSVVVAVYLAWLFLEKNPLNGGSSSWVSGSRSWVVFPVAGVLFAAVAGLVHLLSNKKNDRNG
ncbi:MAG: helix-turn-helix transcriptional regulator [Ruminococcaceae bacterium]|nr:helix-turn-helix transcriptional regulator [Oscillospiraceae bacterium]